MSDPVTLEPNKTGNLKCKSCHYVVGKLTHKKSGYASVVSLNNCENHLITFLSSDDINQDVKKWQLVSDPQLKKVSLNIEFN